jgi:hypothetical protein
VNLYIKNIFTASESLQITDVITLIIAIITFLITLYLFVLKYGIKFKATLSLTSNSDSNVPFFTQITILNLKDKVILITAIYVKINNIYILIKDYKENPLVLNSLSAVNIDTHPVEFYTWDMNKVEINEVFSSTYKKKIVIFTTSGKVEVEPSSLSSHYQELKKPFIKKIKPVRLFYHENISGSAVKYVLTFYKKGSISDVIKINELDLKLKTNFFNYFKLTDKCLENSKFLYDYIEKQKQNKLLHYDELFIVDCERERKRIFSHFLEKKEILIKPIDLKKYKILEFYYTLNIFTKIK